MLTRALSGVVFVSLLVFCMLYHPISFLGLFYLFMVLGIYEFSKMLKIKSYWLYSIGTLLFLYSTPYLTNTTSILIISLASIAILFLFLNALFSKSNDVIHLLGTQFLCIIYSILPFLFIAKIPFTTSSNLYEGELILGVFVLIWANDTFAYLIGRSLGKHKLLERVSPKKTMEGFFGGVLVTMIISYLIGKYVAIITPTQWIILGAIVSVFGVLGDLIASLFKRQTGVKDTGNIIPGHGGIIDRLDSVIFAAPFIFIYLKLILAYVS